MTNLIDDLIDATRRAYRLRYYDGILDVLEHTAHHARAEKEHRAGFDAADAILPVVADAHHALEAACRGIEEDHGIDADAVRSIALASTTGVEVRSTHPDDFDIDGRYTAQLRDIFATRFGGGQHDA